MIRHPPTHHQELFNWEITNEDTNESESELSEVFTIGSVMKDGVATLFPVTTVANNEIVR